MEADAINEFGMAKTIEHQAAHITALSERLAKAEAALREIVRNETEVFDEDTNGMVWVSLDEDEMRDIAVAALNPTEEQP